MKKLVLTLDYELFGNGRGDLFKDLINPMYEILRVCELNNIKLTIFFEVLEYLEFKKQVKLGNFMGYGRNPIDAIHEQISYMVGKGHDIQLHIHPQWVGAEFKDGRWVLDLKNWAVSRFESEFMSFDDMFSNSVKELELLIRQFDQNYSCIAFRAGAYNAVPSGNLFRQMLINGVVIDSSVYPGGFKDDGFSKYDYTLAPWDMDEWWVEKDDFSRISSIDTGVLEVPIVAKKISRIRKYVQSKSKLPAANGNVKSVSKTRMSLIHQLCRGIYCGFGVLRRESFTWDFCMFRESLHKEYFDYIEKNMKSRSRFVLIGHPKSLCDISVFEGFLDVARKRRVEYEFSTIRDSYT